MRLSKNSYIIIGSVACIITFLTARFYSNRNNNELDNNALISVCTLSETEGKRFKYEFLVGNRKYTGTQKRVNYFIQNGESYEIEYLERDPNINRIRFDSPIIGQYFLTAEIQSIRYDSNGVVYFTYYVDNKSIKRVAYLKDNKYARDIFEVKYSPTNPHIGYLVKKNQSTTNAD